jgi:hypothetical protein
MWPILVVVLAPILQLFAGVGKGPEPVRVEALRPEAPVEGLDEGVDAPMSVKSLFRPLQLGLAWGRDTQRSHERRSV